MKSAQANDTAIKITFRTTQSILRELKHIAADRNLNLTYILNEALNRYIESYNISTFRGDELRDAVAELMMLTMKRLRQVTRNDETVEVNIHSIYEEACSEAGSPGGIGSYDPTNQTLRNRVVQELFGRGFISQGKTKGTATITYMGKSRPEFV